LEDIAEVKGSPLPKSAVNHLNTLVCILLPSERGKLPFMLGMMVALEASGVRMQSLLSTRNTPKYLDFEATQLNSWA